MMDDAILIETQQLCRLMHQRGVEELSITRPDFSIALKAIPKEGVPVAIVTPPSAVESAISVADTSVPETPAVTGYTIASPLIGIFYRAPSPDAPPFVEVGDSVEAGQTIGVVEAMKVFNEITTEQTGTVVAIMAENAALVQVGQPLVVIDPHA